MASDLSSIVDSAFLSLRCGLRTQPRTVCFVSAGWLFSLSFKVDENKMLFCYRMVKERLGLPKDQTIVFNVHRFAGVWLLLSLTSSNINGEERVKGGTDRKNMNKLTV